MRVLNYAPGPVLTEMATKHIQQDPNTDPELRQWSLDKMAKGEYLKTEQTVDRLMEILEKDKYESGDHVDYFDKVPN